VENRVVQARRDLVSVVKKVARREDVKIKLAEAKEHRSDLQRPDFVWYELLLSFATMGNSRGASGLIRNKDNYKRVTFEALRRKGTKKSRLKELRAVLHAARVRMPDKKAVWLAEDFDRVALLGGPKQAKEDLFKRNGCEGKMQFWREFKGIGKKYARNIMMDAYHPDFRNSIAVDARIKRISQKLGLSFKTYEDEEQFYLTVATRSGLEGWDLDRIMYRFRDSILDELENIGDIAAARKALKEGQRISWEEVKKELNL
jgi:hypothetical protein